MKTYEFDGILKNGAEVTDGNADRSPAGKNSAGMMIV